MQITVNLTAGQRVRQVMGGKYLVIIGTGAAQSIELGIWAGTHELDYIRTARKGTKARLQDFPFTHVELLSSVDAAVELVISEGLVDFDFTDGAVVHIGTDSFGESVGKPVFVSGITYDDTPATAVDESATVAATAVPAVLIAANVSRKALRILNTGPDSIAIGGAGLTWAKRVIVLAAGVGWEESSGAAVAWSVVCNAGDTASVNVQEVLL